MADHIFEPQSYTISEHDTVRLVHHITQSTPAQKLSFIVSAGASLEYYFLVTGMVSTSIDIEIILNGPRASAIVKGAYSLTGQSELKIDTKQIHNAPYTSSSLEINGMLFDAASLSYQGLIHIESNAHQSTALQKNKTLVFCALAKVRSIPSLQVLTDSVRCAHGSAIGKLDAQALEYLHARGLQPWQARLILVQGFFAQYFSGYTQDNGIDMDDAMSQLLAPLQQESL